jgi:formylmethanofuran dehydrogenase subunit E
MAESQKCFYCGKYVSHWDMTTEGGKRMCTECAGEAGDGKYEEERDRRCEDDY